MEDLMQHGVISTLMRLQQKAIIIHDKLFIIANLFGEENFTVSKSLRQKIFTYLFIFLSRI
jgi:hypothetical protein